MAGRFTESPNSPGSEPPAVSRSLIVTLRILLLLVAAGAVVAGVTIVVYQRAGGDSGVRYRCPMHPEVRAKARGECPICHMDLEPVGRDSAANATAHSDAQRMADLTAVENVRKHKIVDFVRMRSLLSNTREMRGPAWVDKDGAISALFYVDQIAALGDDETGTLSLTRTPTATFSVARIADPAVPWDRSTSRIRFRLAGKGDRAVALETGQVGWLVLSPRAREVLGVPSAAVLQSPEGPYVLAWVGGLNFEKRPIEIAETFLKQGFAVVLSGLTSHDRVVSKATFFVDADRRLGNHGEEGDQKSWGAE
jgi:hypothetical protein